MQLWSMLPENSLKNEEKLSFGGVDVERVRGADLGGKVRVGGDVGDVAALWRRVVEVHVAGPHLPEGLPVLGCQLHELDGIWLNVNV